MFLLKLFGLVLTFLVLVAGLASCRSSGAISVVARRRFITAEDGFRLLTYELIGKSSSGAAQPRRAALFYIQGSSCETVLRNTEALAGAVAMGARVVVAERRGVGEEGKVDAALCSEHSAKARRVEDHALVLREHLKDLPADLPVILVGGSEGGDVAARVARIEPRVGSLVLLGTGGGWSQEQEIRHMLAVRGRYLGLETPADFEAVLAQIRQAPDSLQMWAGHPFRRWSSYLWDPPLRDLSELEIPIFLAHGAADESVPVESARAVREDFERRGKKNLTYREYAGTDHSFYDTARRASLLPLLEIDLARWFAAQGVIAETEREALEQRVRASHPELFAAETPP